MSSSEEENDFRRSHNTVNRSEEKFCRVDKKSRYDDDPHHQPRRRHRHKGDKPDRQGHATDSTSSDAERISHQKKHKKKKKRHKDSSKSRYDEVLFETYRDHQQYERDPSRCQDSNGNNKHTKMKYDREHSSSNSFSDDNDATTHRNDSNQHKHRKEPRHHKKHRERDNHRDERKRKHSPTSRDRSGHDSKHRHDTRRIKDEPADTGYERHNQNHQSRHIKHHSDSIKRERHDDRYGDHNRHIYDRHGSDKSGRERRNLQDQRHERAQNEQRRREHHQQRWNESGSHEWGRRDQGEGSSNPQQPKEQPNFELSGKLTEDTNMYKGVVIKYNEPPEARKPKRRWRLYPFKGDEQLKVLHIHRQSAYLLGRERKIADIPIDHPSCSKQHAVLQFRLVEYERPNHTTGLRVRPYIIDLNSANGTFVNNKQIEAQRYVELFEKDVVKFGFSSREYVLMHDQMQVEMEEDEGVDGDGSEPVDDK